MARTRFASRGFFREELNTIVPKRIRDAQEDRRFEANHRDDGIRADDFSNDGGQSQNSPNEDL